MPKVITINATYEFFEENNKGSLTKEKFANSVILDKNSLTVNLLEIKYIQVLETVKEEESVFKK